MNGLLAGRRVARFESETASSLCPPLSALGLEGLLMPTSEYMKDPFNLQRPHECESL